MACPACGYEIALNRHDKERKFHMAAVLAAVLIPVSYHSLEAIAVSISFDLLAAAMLALLIVLYVLSVRLPLQAWPRYRITSFQSFLQQRSRTAATENPSSIP